MTMSEFDTLRADISGLRTDLHGQVAQFRTDLHGQVGGFRTQMGTLRTDMEIHFARIYVRLERLESKIDDKPSVATIYQASLATMPGCRP